MQVAATTLRARVTATVPVDALVAIALAVWAVAEGLVLDPPASATVVTAWALAVTLPIVWRRRRPVLVAAVVLVAFALGLVLDTTAWSSITPGPSLLLVLYSVGAHARLPSRRWATVVGGTLALAVLAIVVAFDPFEYEGGNDAIGYAFLALVLGGAWAAGHSLRSWTIREHNFARRSGELAAEREARIEEAVAAERARIAAELHEIVASAVSGVAVQAGAAARLLDDEPDRAAACLRTVQETARGALREMRRLLAVLRADEPVSYDPQPGLGEVRDLVAAAQGAGRPATLVEDGDPRPVPASVELAAHRVAQIGLERTGRSPVRIELHHGEDALEVAVTGEGTVPPADSFDGLRERIRLLGGALNAGPVAGGWTLRARLPRVLPAARSHPVSAHRPDRCGPEPEKRRRPRLDPRLDVAPAAIFAGLAAAEALALHGGGDRPPVLQLLLAVALGGALLLRRQHPVRSTIAVVALLALRGAWDPDAMGFAIATGAALAAGSVALHGRTPRDAAAGGAVALAGMAAMLAATGGALGDYAVVLGLVAAAWSAGWAVRRRAGAARALRLRGARLVAEREARVRAAVAAERAGIARELHDVVAHSVSIISVQAGGGEHLVRRDPERARECVAAVRATAHEALLELSRLLAILRDEQPEGLIPEPGLDALEDLIAQARRAGLDVGLTVDGRLESVPAGIALSAYRIVQEALTNARRHAGGAPANVVVRRGDGALHVEVVNGRGGRFRGPARAFAPGHGLVGMHERARVCGGRVHAGPDGRGGWAVRAALPLEDAA